MASVFASSETQACTAVRFGVATPVMRPSSRTEPTSASSSSGRPLSTSWSIDVLCFPTASAPAMRFSSETGKRTPSFSPISWASRIIRSTSACVGGNWMRSTSVACVSALIGLKVQFPQSFTHSSERRSLDTRTLKPASRSSFTVLRRRSVSAPSISPSEIRSPST